MSLWKRGRQYWADFTVAGRRYRKRLGTTKLHVATRRERQLIEDAGLGGLAAHEQGPKRLSDAVSAYLEAKRMRCSPRTLELEQERLVLVQRHFGDVPLAAITANAIADFQRSRHDAGIANRTINMDVGVLSRVLKSCGRWRALAEHVRNLPERQHPIGRALTDEERQRLFDAAASNPEWEHVYCAAVVAANTSMRPVEVKHLRRRDVDVVRRLVHVRRSKNETSHRVIPLNAPAVEAIVRMLDRANLLGHTEPDHFFWPACQWGRYDGTKPMLKWDTAWRRLRDAAGLPGLRFHDLRHTVITELAEMGVADHVLESISGHLSRRMLEHYSHIRIDAKRQALNALDETRRRADTTPDITAGVSSGANDGGHTEVTNLAEMPIVVTLRDGTSQFTSQFTSQSALAGSPPSARLLIPVASERAASARASLTERDLSTCFSGETSRARERVRGLGTKSPDQIRRDVRVVEGARLESVCRGNSTVGSNPTLSASFHFAGFLSNSRDFRLENTHRVPFRVPFWNEIDRDSADP
jgi:integrase